MSLPLNKCRILITGVHGQVGFELLKSLSVCGAELVVAARHSESVRGLGLRSVGLDLTDLDSITSKIKEIGPNIIINAAAYTAVDKAEIEHDSCFLVNEKAVGLMGKLMAALGGAMIHFSTDYVYNPGHDQPNREDGATLPGNVYARSKLDGEKALIESGVAHLILRTSWVYGINGNNFVKTMLRLGKEHETLKVVNDQIGSPTSAVTLAQVVASILSQGSRDPVGYIRSKEGLYNVSDSGFTSWHLFATEIFRQSEGFGIELKVKEVLGIQSVEYKTPAQRPRNSRLSLEKIEKVFSLKTPDWKHSLAVFLNQGFKKIN